MLGVGSKFTFRIKVFRTTEQREMPAPNTGLKANENSPSICIDTDHMEIKLISSRSLSRDKNNSPAYSMSDTRALVRTGINEMDSFPPATANESL